jgi:hypothetical protein
VSLHLVPPPAPREPEPFDLGTVPLDGLLVAYRHALKTCDGHAAEILTLAALEIADAIHRRARRVALEAVRACLVPTLPPNARAAWFAAQGDPMAAPVPTSELIPTFAARVARAVKARPSDRPQLEALLAESVRLAAASLAKDALDRALQDLTKETPAQ